MLLRIGKSNIRKECGKWHFFPPHWTITIMWRKHTIAMRLWRLLEELAMLNNAFVFSTMYERGLQLFALEETTLLLLSNNNCFSCFNWKKTRNSHTKEEREKNARVKKVAISFLLAEMVVLRFVSFYCFRAEKKILQSRMHRQTDTHNVWWRCNRSM